MARSILPLLLILLLITPLSCQSLPAEGPQPGEGRAEVKDPLGHEAHSTSSATAMDPIARTVEIRRTSYGVPHILAEELSGAGYGLAWVMMEDYREEVARAILQSNGRWGLAVGGDSIRGDFAGRMAHEYAAWTYHLLPADVREVLDGFARGMNDFARVYRDELPDWVPEDFTAHDIAARDIGVWNARAVTAFSRARMESPGNDGDEQALDLSSSDLLSTWMAWAQREGEGDPEVGSNAWAFAPERSASGNALLLRNPHLSWTAGYYEAHLRVPGILDFYGDFRLGGPFTTIGGFNHRLGFATTNNSPDLDQLYALLRDPDNPDAYLFDGSSVPLETRSVTVDFKDGAGIGSETQEFKFSPLGPVIFESPDTLFVLKSHSLTQYRVGEQWLRMMQAQNLEEWKEAMRIRAKVSSNLTYADADGNILLFWNAAIPLLPHDYSPGEAALATSSAEVWTELYPFDELPQLLHVVRGEMSLVGPRPVERAVWDQLEPWEQARSVVRPGITGMWQLDRLRRWRLEQMIVSDLLYLLRWSPGLDLRILARTLLGRT